MNNIDEILRLGADLTGAELVSLVNHYRSDPTPHRKMAEQDLAAAFEKAKDLWARLNLDGDQGLFKIRLHEACTHSKAIWTALDRLEKLEQWERRTDLRDKLQTVYDDGLSFGELTIDNEVFHVDCGAVVHGPNESAADIPF